ncbi:MAG: thiamine pyrophosphate-dependent dehydrogenase E1 component subunit alpha [Burkholderiales bacterium]
MTAKVHSKKPDTEQAAQGAALGEAELRQMYRDMLRIRMVEEEIAVRYPKEMMRCPVHLSIGQEAVPVGISRLLRPSDQVVSTHRCHAHYLAKGGNLAAMLGELMGRQTGCCGGRGGSMHLFDSKAGMLLSLPIVAASIPVGVGAALALKQRGTDGVAVIYLGDASLEEGVYHESANFAALHALPAIFVCENNLYSVYTPLRERQPDRPLAELGRAHGMPAERIDGNYIEAVHGAAAAAVARARAGRGPSFIQADTYRWREHCGPNYDNQIGYRTEAEFQSWKAQDPIEQLRRRLSSSGKLSPAEEARMKQEIAAEVEREFDAAEKAPAPDPATIAARIYAG